MSTSFALFVAFLLAAIEIEMTRKLGERMDAFMINLDALKARVAVIQAEATNAHAEIAAAAKADQDAVDEFVASITPAPAQ